MFDELVWLPDRMLLRDLVFRLEHFRDERWELGDRCFCFYKVKPLVDAYQRFLATRPSFRPREIVELGMWDGGSIVFWFELFEPQHHLGVDIQRKEDSRYFRDYVAARGLGDRIRTFWGVDQRDTPRLREIVDTVGGRCDLVIDDASHLYAETRASFEALFPRLRPGGLYIIEDWAWAYWPAFHGPDHPWRHELPASRLVMQLIEAVGSSSQASLVANLHVFQGFVAVERGADDGRDPRAPYDIAAAITRRPDLGQPV